MSPGIWNPKACVRAAMLYFHPSVEFFFFFLTMHLFYMASPDLSWTLENFEISWGMWVLYCSLWDVVTWPGMETGHPELGPQSLSHWTIRETPSLKIHLHSLICSSPGTQSVCFHREGLLQSHLCHGTRRETQSNAASKGSPSTSRRDLPNCPPPRNLRSSHSQDTTQPGWIRNLAIYNLIHLPSDALLVQVWKSQVSGTQRKKGVHLEKHYFQSYLLQLWTWLRKSWSHGIMWQCTGDVAGVGTLMLVWDTGTTPFSSGARCHHQVISDICILITCPFPNFLQL